MSSSEVHAHRSSLYEIGDICQECCPFNRQPSTSRNPTLFPTEEPAYQSRDVTVNSTVSDLLYLTEEEFRQKFKGSPVKRTKLRGLLRNAAYTLCNREDEESIVALKHALNDPEELVREAAAWSLSVIEERNLNPKQNKK